METSSPSAGRRTFREEPLERDLEERGYAVARLLEADRAAALREAILALRGESRFAQVRLEGQLLPNHNSALDEDPEYRRRISTLAVEALAPSIAAILDRYRIVSAALVLKNPGAQEVSLHSDWTLTREPELRTVTIWCALADVDPGNGGLEVVPGSHRLVPQVTGPGIAEYHFPFAQRLRPYAVPVPLRAGEAVLFDYTLLHGSSVNASGAPRPAIMLSCVPEEAEAVFYRNDPGGEPGRLEMLAWPEGGYLEPGAEAGAREDPARRNLGYVDNPNPSLSLRDFERLYEERNRSSGLRRAPPRGLAERVKLWLQR